MIVDLMCERELAVTSTVFTMAWGGETNLTDNTSINGTDLYVVNLSDQDVRSILAGASPYRRPSTERWQPVIKTVSEAPLRGDNYFRIGRGKLEEGSGRWCASQALPPFCPGIWTYERSEGWNLLGQNKVSSGLLRCILRSHHIICCTHPLMSKEHCWDMPIGHSAVGQDIGVPTT
jgi:hypothetical protein